MSAQNKNAPAGFSMLEVIITLFLLVVIMVMVGSVYSLSNRAYNKSSAKAELSQNVRVALNRMNREVRQSREIVTDLSPERDSAASELLFEDGHDTEETAYIKYYLDNDNLRRSKIVYYFPSEEKEYVKHNSKDKEGDLPEKKVVTDHLVGEHFQSLSFWGGDKLINIECGLELRGFQFGAGSSIYSRN